MRAADPVVGVDLGGTNLRAALVAPDGTLQHRLQIPTPHDAPDPSPLIELVRSVRVAAGLKRHVPTVVAVPGSVDYRDQQLMAAPNLPADWVPHLEKGWLSDRLGAEVVLANDADLATVGEAWFGAGQGAADVVYVTISTGIGAGAVLGRQLVRGHWSGLELGHTVIDRTRLDAGLPATVELLGSGTALALAAHDAGLGALRGPQIVDRLRAADPGALAIWEDATRAAALGIVNLSWMLSPEVIVIGGGVGMNWDLLEPILARTLAEAGPSHLDISLVPAALGDDAALAGAAAWSRATTSVAAQPGVGRD